MQEKVNKVKADLKKLDDGNKKSHLHIRKQLSVLRKKADSNKDEVTKMKMSFKNYKKRRKLQYGSQKLELKKGLINPNYKSKTVLTDSTWSYVEIFLKGKKADDALTYWNQAQNFYEANKNLDFLSKPLTSYYCLLNATKALLTYKEINFDLKHGVSGEKTNGHFKISNEIVKIYPKGILAGLCKYFDDIINVPHGGKSEDLSLKEMLYNLEYIHRAYNLTFSNSTELFIPIKNCQFVYDKNNAKGWFQAELESKLSSDEIVKKLIGFNLDKVDETSGNYIIKRNKSFKWEAPRNKPSQESLEKFNNYYFKLRKQLRYIYSPNDLWYIKRQNVKGVIDKNPIVLTYACMHRLSELSRYEPSILKKYLEGQESWLIMEFISKSIEQFIDNISSEITGDDFRVTGFRT